MLKSEHHIANSIAPERRLRLVMLVFFFALLIPLTVLFGWTYRRLADEHFIGLRIDAEAVISEIEIALKSIIETEELRPFDEYSFFSVTKSSLLSEQGVRYSPLAEYPVKSGIPGIVGYFQVNPDKSFQTPLLPEGASLDARDTLAGAGLEKEEFLQRQALQENIWQAVQGRLRKDSPEMGKADAAKELREKDRAQGLAGAAPPAPAAEAMEGQALSDLKLDDAFLKRNFAAVQKQEGEAKIKSQISSAKRIEQVSIPLQSKYLSSTAKNDEVNAPSLSSPSLQVEQDAPALSNLAKKIVTFEGEIDPLQIKLVDDNRLLFFRRVWKEKSPFIQGFVVDRERFFAELLDKPFLASPLAGAASLRLAYQDRVIRSAGNLSAKSSEKLILEEALPAPLQTFSLVIAAPTLMLGKGATLIFTLSFIILGVVLVGLYLIYRLSLSQIRLAEKKSDFVSAVSHELKTPLTSIRMYAEMLKSGWVLDQEKIKSYYEYIFSESERLSRLIGNVLDLAGLSRNQEALPLTSMKVEEALTLIGDKVKRQVEHVGFTLELHGESNAADYSISLNEDAFSRIFINLVDNALKFSRNSEKRVVEYGARIIQQGGGERIQFFVRDFGSGVPPQQQRAIFELFYRIESELTRTTPGTGIGLALVKELARKMDAAVDVVNVNPGAEFRIIFSPEEKLYIAP